MGTAAGKNGVKVVSISGEDSFGASTVTNVGCGVGLNIGKISGDAALFHTIKGFTWLDVY